jgi:hypothetical protein
MKSSALFLIAIFALVACGKPSSSDSSKSKSGEPTAKKSDKPTATVIKQLDGLKADLPAGANISKGIMGKGVLIQAPGVVVSIALASASDPKTVEEAKKKAEMFTPKKIKTEKLSDGWVFSFENKGGMGTNYFVRVRRTIGGKTYTCTTTAHRPAQQTNAIKVCKSLTK